MVSTLGKKLLLVGTPGTKSCPYVCLPVVLSARGWPAIMFTEMNYESGGNFQIVSVVIHLDASNAFTLILLPISTFCWCHYPAESSLRLFWIVSYPVTPVQQQDRKKG